MSWTDDGGSTCDDSRTVTWYYKPQTLADWLIFSFPNGGPDTNSPPFVSETSDTLLSFDYNSWDYGDVAGGTTDFSFFVRHEIPDPANTYVDWPFTVTLSNPCYDDAPTRTSTVGDVNYIVEADGATNAAGSNPNTVTWANTAGEAACA